MIVGLLSGGELFEEFSQVGSAPAAAGTCAVAFAQLTRMKWLFHANEIDDFPFGYVKAQTEFVVILQEIILRRDQPVASRHAIRHAF